MDFKYCKLEIFIPETHLPALQKTLREVDAGHIGNYDSCMSSSEVIGYWRPLEGCNPYIGNEGEISKEPEVKVEVTVFTEAVDRTIEAIKKIHPDRADLLHRADRRDPDFLQSFRKKEIYSRSDADGSGNAFV